MPNILYFCRHFSEHIYIDIMSKNKLNLLVDFPEVTTEEWMEVVKADLKGADFDKKLLWKTNEGFNVKPFYRAEDITGIGNNRS
jgi:methylmalonyl-CoA mutase